MCKCCKHPEEGAVQEEVVGPLWMSSCKPALCQPHTQQDSEDELLLSVTKNTQIGKTDYSRLPSRVSSLLPPSPPPYPGARYSNNKDSRGRQLWRTFLCAATYSDAVRHLRSALPGKMKVIFAPPPVVPILDDILSSVERLSSVLSDLPLKSDRQGEPIAPMCSANDKECF